MKVSEIFDIEKENHTSCFLKKDGIFWRAYEKSVLPSQSFLSSFGNKVCGAAGNIISIKVEGKDKVFGVSVA